MCAPPQPRHSSHPLYRPPARTQSSRLIKVKVNDSLHGAVTRNQQLLSGMGLQPGRNLLILNGMMLSPAVDVFALLDLLRAEWTCMAALQQMGIPVSC